MFRSILVPLDRSTFAEQALPLALAVARRTGARLHLGEVHGLYALDNPHACWGPYEPDRDTECRQQEQLYLDATARWLSAVPGVSVTAGTPCGTAVIPETIAEGVLEQAREVAADLIVAATHGRSPLGRLVCGGVAHSIVRQSGVPVLLVKADGPPRGLAPEPVPEEVLIPLDGSPPAERVVEPAMDLARLSEARCTLLRVVRPCRFADQVHPETAEAEAYLERIAETVRKQGLDVGTRVVQARDPAEVIVKEAGSRAGVLVAMTTHGRGGLGRLLMGSVAERVLHETEAPVLLYHPPGGSQVRVTNPWPRSGHAPHDPVPDDGTRSPWR